MVLYRSAMPSVLVEAGFLSNKDEETYLVSEKGQTELATAMYNGFAKLAEAKTVAVDYTGVDTTTQTPKVVSDTKPEPTPTPTPTTSSSNVVYKVQFMTTPLKLAANDPKLKGLPDIEIEAVGNDYRYTSGKCTTQTQANELLTRVKNAGFKDAFVITVDKAKATTNTDTQKPVLTNPPKSEPSTTGTQKPATTTPPKNDTPTTQQTPTSKVSYRIQIMAHPQKLEPNDSKLKGLPDIGFEPIENAYRYTTGKYNSYAQAKEALPKVKEKFKDAFIVCYNSEGQRITLKEAQSLENKK